MQTPQETDSGLKKEVQHKGEHDGKDDRACYVERRQDTQREHTTEKERPWIGRQRHLGLVGGLGRRRMRLRQINIQHRRQSGTLRWSFGGNHWGYPSERKPGVRSNDLGALRVRGARINYVAPNVACVTETFVPKAPLNVTT